MATVAEIQPRLLMGPGPSEVHPRVLAALAHPTVGHLDSQFVALLDDLGAKLRLVFQTANPLTLAISGTGSAGMETCVVNLIEPGDKMLVCVNGVFGMRMADVAQRCGAIVTTIEQPWGQVFSPQQIEEACKQHGPFKLVGIIHAETSTGAAQPIPEISKIVHDRGSLLLVDAVTSLGGMPLAVDDWRIDACYSGTQKCLSCPPGLSPITISPAAQKIIASRKRKVQSWYLDLNMIGQYWGSERLYHHTAPINMVYALHEAVSIVLEDGLPNRWERHREHHEALHAGITALGLRYLADPAHQLPMLNAIAAPPGVDEATVRQRLVREFAVEIGGGLGAFKGKAWRIGLMGQSASAHHVTTCLSALGQALADINAVRDGKAGVAAAQDYYRSPAALAAPQKG